MRGQWAAHVLRRKRVLDVTVSGRGSARVVSGLFQVWTLSVVGFAEGTLLSKACPVLRMFKVLPWRLTVNRLRWITVVAVREAQLLFVTG